MGTSVVVFFRQTLPADRLLRVCWIAQIDLIDVFSMAAKKHPKHTVVTAEQNHLFFEKPEFLTYFLKLTSEYLSPDEIAEAENLNPRTTQNEFLQHTVAQVLSAD